MVLGLPSPQARDFTIKKYRELCLALLMNRYTPLSVGDYLELELSNGGKTVIIRHDVDRKIMNAIHLAELEYELGIRSTYYFRYPYTFRPDVIRAIRDMGHEIGYHYETLSKVKGDHKLAIQLFQEEIAMFRKISGCRITTISMHGTPLSPYDNRDLWKFYNFRDYGIDGEAYLSFTGNDLRYLTDTGRSWSGKHSIRDMIPGQSSFLPISTTDHLIRWIDSCEERCLYLTVHPERWTDNGRRWAISYIEDLIVNTGKTLLLGIR